MDTSTLSDPSMEQQIKNGKLVWENCQMNKSFEIEFTEEEYMKHINEIIGSIEHDRSIGKQVLAFLQCKMILSIIKIDWKMFSQKKMVVESDQLPLTKEKIKEVLIKLAYEMSILIFYLSKEKENLKIAGWLTDLVSLSLHDQPKLADSAYNNNLFYIDQLNPKSIRLEIDMPIIHDGSSERYRHSNPSILQVGDGYVAIIRGVNYHQTNGSHYASLDPDGIVRTRNFLTGLNADFKVLWTIEIIDQSKTKTYPTRVRGHEDCRLFWIAEPIGCPTNYEEDQFESQDSLKKYGIDFGRIGFTCVTQDTRESGRPQVSICKLSSDLTTNGLAKVEYFQPLITPINMHGCEKNWLPFFDQDGSFKLIYGYSPLTILSCPIVDNWKEEITADTFWRLGTIPEQFCCLPFIKNESELNLSMAGFRGSGGPLLCGMYGQKYYLVATHGMIFNGRRFYHTRLILYDLDWKIKAISPAFYCKNRGIEYCVSISFNKTKTEINLSMGIEDREAWVFSISWKEIKEQLISIESFQISH